MNSMELLGIIACAANIELAKQFAAAIIGAFIAAMLLDWGKK